MERVAEPKGLPMTLPILFEVSNSKMVASREMSQRLHRQAASRGRDVSMTRLLSDAERMILIRDDIGFDSRASQEMLEGKISLAESEELMGDVERSHGSSDSFEDCGSGSFAGASHPPEPVDTDLMKTVYIPLGEKDAQLMRTVYVPICQNKPEAGCLMNSFSMKGPFHEDISIGIPTKKPSPDVLSCEEILIEELNDTGNLSMPFSGAQASQNTENSLLPPDSEEKEIVWDASLPPSGNVSPLSSIDSTSVVKAMSIVNSSASTYRSDAFASDGMLSLEKMSIRGDSLESAKTSGSRVSGQKFDLWERYLLEEEVTHPERDWFLIHKVRDTLTGFS
ncbi:hypothetical protein Lal_00011382, partial [Lupinus albus]